MQRSLFDDDPPGDPPAGDRPGTRARAPRGARRDPAAGGPARTPAGRDAPPDDLDLFSRPDPVAAGGGRSRDAGSRADAGTPRAAREPSRAPAEAGGRAGAGRTEAPAARAPSRTGTPRTGTPGTGPAAPGGRGRAGAKTRGPDADAGSRDEGADAREADARDPAVHETAARETAAPDPAVPERDAGADAPGTFLFDTPTPDAPAPAKARRPAARRVVEGALARVALHRADAPARLPARSEIDGCRRCELWRDATQGVPGEGPSRAPLMLVGEQPGDSEDRQGRPFVGPAGRLLDELLAESGIARAKVFTTNAVKHFKWEPRGSRRIHKTPAQREVEACGAWLERELAAAAPRAVVALGATAARALLGPDTTIESARREGPVRIGDTWVVVTFHPSALLRVPDPAVRARMTDAVRADLAKAAALADDGAAGRRAPS
ncbi:MAG TPA: UdgX family uracil-DNA binding protein [Burkholderiaceae bacterium]|nr:UdgX family uracil-DNA binding protein [Burkholderiaceae bacterium]